MIRTFIAAILSYFYGDTYFDGMRFDVLNEPIIRFRAAVDYVFSQGETLLAFVDYARTMRYLEQVIHALT